MFNRLLLAIVFIALSGCSKPDEGGEADGPSIEFPNYLAINAQDPAKPWYMSDYFKRVQQWEVETTDLRDLEFGMYELTQYPDQAPTQAHQDAADKLIRESMDIAVRQGWFDIENGFRDGYEKMFGDRVHYVNVDYVFDGDNVNPEKPEVLMYYKTDDGEFLMGIMFLSAGKRGPQVAGPLSVWHYHIDRGMCYDQGVLPIGRKDEAGTCETGMPNTRSPEMLHVWFFDHPDGRFATTMGLTDEDLRFGVRQIRDQLREYE